ncbi:magnesium and cobalt transport protein CorA [Microbacterium horticulturae]|uniref:Magnesium and cobalt transport protein CorA n=1 Tax=Microbacterium horticulturae TaxID=3028316 RepID=A0ABY8C0M1_9MICO|nr:magnesium and cobalt transport protein CorA [Microbacterium sp. KACC 23027]WEG09968.1 magnesium and cobalt transport protein CorA [Microbacterium sp. KACC 23027]
MPQRDTSKAGSRRVGRFRRRGSAEQSAQPELPHLTQYVADGVPTRQQPGASVAEALEYSQGGPDRMAMFFYPAPTIAEITELADAWELHPLLREDLLNARQRPKLDRYGEVLFLVARSARYIDEAEEVVFAEFHMLVRPNAVAVLCQDERWIDGTDGTDVEAGQPTRPDRRERALLGDRDLLKLGPEAVVYRLLDAIVDGYGPVLQGLSIDKEQIERQVFSGDAAVAERIYRLSQEVIDMQQTVSSLREVVAALQGGFDKYGIPDELQTYLDDVSDHLMRADSRAADLREALSQILNVNATLVAQRQNEDMKKISGWAAILFAPTLIGAIYGMNFDDMPELHWAFGYPMAVAMMVAFAVLLYVIFKRSKWM